GSGRHRSDCCLHASIDRVSKPGESSQRDDRGDERHCRKAIARVRTHRGRLFGIPRRQGDQGPPEHKKCGQTPAYNLTITAFTHTRAFPLPPAGTSKLCREAEETATEILRAGAAALAADGVQSNENEIVLTPKERESLNADAIAIYLRGEITYDDVFGHQRHTAFRLYIMGRDAASGGGPLRQYGEGNEAT